VWVIGFAGQFNPSVTNLICGAAIGWLVVAIGSGYGWTHGASFVAPSPGVSRWLSRLGLSRRRWELFRGLVQCHREGACLRPWRLQCCYQTWPRCVSATGVLMTIGTGACDPATSGATNCTATNTKRGVVDWFNCEHGFGFILPEEGGPSVFVHFTEIAGSGIYHTLQEGETVTYEHDRTTHPPQARNVRISDAAVAGKDRHQKRVRPFRLLSEESTRVR